MRGVSLKRGLLAASIFAIGAAVLLPASSFAAGSIGGRPGLPREDEPRSQSIFIHTLKLGETTKDKVLISNHSDKKQTVELFAVDAITTNTGSFTCKQNTEKRIDTGAWIKLAKNEITLAPEKSELIDFTIAVPKKADVGEHNACIVFSAKDDVEEVGGSLRIRTRSAVRVAVTVPGKLERGVNVQDFTVQQTGGKQQFDLTLRNTGNVSADTKIDVELLSLFGNVAYKNGGEYPVLPGNSLQLSYQNKDDIPFWGGWYKAEATIIYDRDAKKWGTNSARSFLEVKHAEPVTVFVTPQPLAIVTYIVLLVAGMSGLAYWWFGRRKVQLIMNTWHKYTVKEGDTVAGLAKKRHTSWKLIAKVNGLEAPYTLEPGMKVLVPPVRSSNEKPHVKKK